MLFENRTRLRSVGVRVMNSSYGFARSSCRALCSVSGLVVLSSLAAVVGCGDSVDDSKRPPGLSPVVGAGGGGANAGAPGAGGASTAPPNAGGVSAAGAPPSTGTGGGTPSGGAPSGGAPSGGAPSGGAPSGGAPSGGAPNTGGSAGQPP